MSKLQELLDEKYPMRENMSIAQENAQAGRRRIFTEGYNAAMKEMYGTLADLMDLADYGYSAKCAADHPRDKLSQAHNVLNRAKSILEEANK